MDAIEAFAAGLSDICSRTPLAQGRPLTWTVIANPKAGGFTIKSRWNRHFSVLSSYAEKARNSPVRSAWSGPSRTAQEFDGGSGVLGSLGLVPTNGPGHAGAIVEALMDEAGAMAAESGPAPFHLIITAGGDGTSLEAQLSLYAAPAAVRSNCAILRLPMGTGNDGSDGWELSEALDLLIHPARVEYARALRLTTANKDKGPFLAFNILSVGLDAFVTHMTNKMKGNLPGDSYKLWVDIASLLYDRIYKVKTMDVAAFDEAGREVTRFTEPVLLLAMGASGHRTYGSHKWILPDDRNVCEVRQMSLLRKVALKGQFTTGTHIDKPEARLFSASKVEFRYAYPILAQMDGETVRLEDGDFPAAIELTEPVIPILKKL
ncbi:diacylglycerol/lipid kinase family protein [Breznakiella homolactica]|uniref:Diacylglycerol kinase n=1 Tax=Breznakiella homolactica TaxID=2798577 RepID=A0A7T8BA56_9SPIR|nr:diacylglycerol kinase family protein [Breznakiella homolactica]QQO08645.1 diacylglycerol kinase [Breznakiella homolactica]